MGEGEERMQKSWPVGALALAEATGPTSGDSRCFREHEREKEVITKIRGRVLSLSSREDRASDVPRS